MRSLDRAGSAAVGAPAQEVSAERELPGPTLDGAISLERAIATRRSVRRYARRPLRLTDASQLLWAAQGVTDARGLRTAPSAGALYPLRTYLVAARVESLAPGLYAYLASKHRLRALAQACLLSDLTTATWGQDWIDRAAAALVLTADYTPTTARYGERARRYVHIEVGHAAENAHLQATALGLCSAVVGAFDDRAVADLLGCEANERPLCLVAVGRALE